MLKAVSRVIVFGLSVALITCQLPRFSRAAGSLPRGAATAGEAARQRVDASGGADSSPAETRPVPLAFGALGYIGASSDSTVLTFPDEEGDHLKRDVAVFVVVSVFVAIFLVKLFLRGDDTESEEAPYDRYTPPTP